MSFRDAIFRMSPPRLQTPRAAKIVFAMIGSPLDMIVVACDLATKARFPELAPEDALAHIGRDRSIRRGPLEPSANYRARLLLWIDAWKSAAVGRGMLDQLAGYLAPAATRLRIWTQVGVVYTRAANGVFSVGRVTRTSWNWDNNTALWARFWLIIDSFGGTPWERDGTWGDGDRWGEDTATWGSTATIDQVQSIRGIVDDWKPAQSVCKSILVSFDPFAFQEGDTSPPLPDGHWGDPYKIVAGVAVPTRDDAAIYWEGVA